MKECKRCLAFEEKERHGHFKPYCDKYGSFLKSLKCPCETEIITQQCECCGKWVDQQYLVWDLVADRLVCRDCYEQNK